jgi:nucleoid-associated protein YgaU
VSDDRGRPADINGDEPLDESELDPSLAMPSPRVYRGSLIALLLGSVFAVWLLVFPPVGADRDSPPASIDRIAAGATPQPTATSEPTAEPTVAATATPSSVVTATPRATPEVTATGEPTAVPEPEAVTYAVVPGDSMLGIAERFLPPGRETSEFANAIAQANGIFDITQIQVGQVLEIPDQ